ncbi:MAG: RluA family pseudouridine synthase [Anaerolineales bacterium]|nr:RluA family pseudouridine synthase [Anaerolineales bacterium]
MVNKPAGLPTLPDGYHPEAPYLVGLLKQVYQPLWVIHRLDKETSGVMAFARNAAAHRNLNTQFEQRKASKVYHALVRGVPDWATMSVDLPLRPDGDRRHRTVVDAQRGKPALTDLRLMENLGDYALIEAAPHTGRTHQIRVHLAAQGYSLVGDRLYGKSAGLFLKDIHPGSLGPEGETAILSRLGLHAWSLLLSHPANAQPMHFNAPYPDDFASALSHLRHPGG